MVIYMSEEEKKENETEVTKETITKQSVAEELIFHAKVSMPFAIISLVLGIVVLVPISAVLINYVINGFKTGDFKSVRVVFAGVVIAIAAILLFTVVGSLYIVIDLSKKSSMAKSGRFRIEKDELLRKVKDETVSKRTRRSFLKWQRTVITEDVFYFAKYGRYVLGTKNGSAFEYSSEGDEFYVVVYDAKKPRPELIFNSKIYDYKQD